MTDYKAEYLCEQERADKADDALYDMRVRAERVEAELVALQLQNAERETRERALLEAADVGIPWVHGDTFAYVVQELRATRERVAQLERAHSDELESLEADLTDARVALSAQGAAASFFEELMWDGDPDAG